MSLLEQLTEDMKTALKGGEKDTLNTIRQLRAQIKDAQIAKGEELSDDDVVAVLMNAAKKRREAIQMYEQGGRDDLVAKEQAELAVIQKYLPQQMTEEEITQVVSEIIAEVGAGSLQDLGKVMGPVMARVRGRADGKQVQQIARRLLQ